jgi:hypothetical protein
MPPGSVGQTAEQSGQMMTADHVRQKLQQQGYSNVSDLRQEGDKWAGKATKDGRSITFHFDPHSGEVSTR